MLKVGLVCLQSSPNILQQRVKNKTWLWSVGRK